MAIELVKSYNNESRFLQVKLRLMNIEVEKSNNNYKNNEGTDMKANDNKYSVKSKEQYNNINSLRITTLLTKK